MIDALVEMGTATVHEAIGRRGYVGPLIRPIQRVCRHRRLGDHGLM